MAPIIPPIGQEDKRDEDDFEVEILYMHRQIIENGNIYDFEMHFLSDHSVIQKSRRNGDEKLRVKTWEKFDRVARAAQTPGWEIEWNPNWAPHLKEFKKEVSF